MLRHFLHGAQCMSRRRLLRSFCTHTHALLRHSGSVNASASSYHSIRMIPSSSSSSPLSSSSLRFFSSQRSEYAFSSIEEREFSYTKDQLDGAEEDIKMLETRDVIEFLFHSGQYDEARAVYAKADASLSLSHLMIVSFGELHMADEAGEFFDAVMAHPIIEPNATTFSLMIRYLINAGRMQEADAVLQAQIENRSVSLTAYSLNLFLIEFIQQMNHAGVASILQMFEDLGVRKDKWTFNHTLRWMGIHHVQGHLATVHELFAEMAEMDVERDSHTYLHVLMAIDCAQRDAIAMKQFDRAAECPQAAIEYMNRAISEQMSMLHTAVYNTLLKILLASPLHVEEAQRWFKLLCGETRTLPNGARLPRANDITCNIVLRGLVRRKASFELIRDMIDTVYRVNKMSGEGEMQRSTYNTLLQAFGHLKEYEKMHEAYLDMRKHNIEPSSSTVKHIMDSFFDQRQPLMALDYILTECVPAGVPPHMTSWEALMRGLARENNVPQIRQALQSMRVDFGHEPSWKCYRWWCEAFTHKDWEFDQQEIDACMRDLRDSEQQVDEWLTIPLMITYKRQGKWDLIHVLNEDVMERRMANLAKYPHKPNRYHLHNAYMRYIMSLCSEESTLPYDSLRLMLSFEDVDEWAIKSYVARDLLLYKIAKQKETFSESVQYKANKLVHTDAKYQTKLKTQLDGKKDKLAGHLTGARRQEFFYVICRAVHDLDESPQWIKPTSSTVRHTLAPFFDQHQPLVALDYILTECVPAGVPPHMTSWEALMRGLARENNVPQIRQALQIMRVDFGHEPSSKCYRWWCEAFIHKDWEFDQQEIDTCMRDLRDSEQQVNMSLTTPLMIIFQRQGKWDLIHELSESVMERRMANLTMYPHKPNRYQLENTYMQNIMRMCKDRSTLPYDSLRLMLSIENVDEWAIKSYAARELLVCKIIKQGRTFSNTTKRKADQLLQADAKCQRQLKTQQQGKKDRFANSLTGARREEFFAVIRHALGDLDESPQSPSSFSHEAADSSSAM